MTTGECHIRGTYTVCCSSIAVVVLCQLAVVRRRCIGLRLHFIRVNAGINTLFQFRTGTASDRHSRIVFLSDSTTFEVIDTSMTSFTFPRESVNHRNVQAPIFAGVTPNAFIRYSSSAIMLFGTLKNINRLRPLFFSLALACITAADAASESSDWTQWHRPVDQPVFTPLYGKNHDAILFAEHDLEYPYQMIISHTKDKSYLWRSKTFSWSSADWELVSDNYQIHTHPEYDDGVKVDGTYYIYEGGNVFTYTGTLSEANGNWELAGTFPKDQADDVGVYFEDGVFHLFGEYGHHPSGRDGTSLSHLTSETGLGDWTLVNTKAIDPNPDGGNIYGVGDPTIVKIDGYYYIFCDEETLVSPYKIVVWRSNDLNGEFESLGTAIAPRSDEEDDWDNDRIQDADIVYVPELSRYVITANMRDIDGNPGGGPLKDGGTQVIGVFYSNATISIDDTPSATDPLAFEVETIPQQNYPSDIVDFALTLPAASSGGTPVYSLTAAIEGLSFNPATRLLTVARPAFDTAVLTYTATDGTTNSASLTFTVTVVDVNVDDAGIGTLEYYSDSDLDGAIAVNNVGTENNNNNNMRLFLPDGHSVYESSVIVTTYNLSADAASPAPDGVTFSGVAIDIAIPAITSGGTTTETAQLLNGKSATVCLSDANATARVMAVYRYDMDASAWEKTGPAIRKFDDFVCGTTTAFSPFALGFAVDSKLSTTTRLNEQILTRASQTMTASTLAAVAARVDSVVDGGGWCRWWCRRCHHADIGVSIRRPSSLRGLLESHARAMLEGGMEYERLLDGASFVLPLRATDGATDGTTDGNNKHGASALSLWGSTDNRNLDGDEDGIDWDGDVFSLHLGIDTQFSQQMMAGVALSWNESSFDYQDDIAGSSGEYQYRSTNLHPYIGWFPTDDWKLWATAGYGQGEIENDTDGGTKHATDSAQLSLSGGFSRQLSGGTTLWSLKGDVSLVQVAVDKGDGFAAEDIDSQRLRLLVSGERNRKTTSGGVLTPSLEIGVRSDGGDGESGTGAELGGGLRYTNPGGNLTVSGNIRTLLAAYNEWGADFSVRLSPQSGRGLSLSPASGMGQDAECRRAVVEW